MHPRVSLAALGLFAGLVALGLIGALGPWALLVAPLLAALVLAPAGRLPEALRPRRPRALLAWAIGLLVVAIATLGDEGPLRTVCAEGGECSTRAVDRADEFFVAYLASAAAFAVWLLVRRPGGDRAEGDGAPPYASDQSSPAA